jgi:hypothetical protein
VTANQLKHFADCVFESQPFKRDINVEFKHSIDLSCDRGAIIGCSGRCDDEPLTFRNIQGRCFRPGLLTGLSRYRLPQHGAESARISLGCYFLFQRQTLSIASHDTPIKPSLWRPLRTPVFRNLLAANVVSDIGAFMQVVGAAWLMLSLRAGPMYVALIQTASALPYVLLALPAGAVGDIVDRRKLILSTETWMLSVALILTIVTISGRITPLLLLLLTFALSSGDAFETPTWRAVLPELVTKEDLPSASALNGIEFNFARAVGPALAGAVIAVWGVGRAFLLNTVSFVGVIVVVARWRRLHRKRTVPVETLSGATIAALRFVRFAPAVRAVIL